MIRRLAVLGILSVVAVSIMFIVLFRGSLPFSDPSCAGPPPFYGLGDDLDPYTKIRSDLEDVGPLFVPDWTPDGSQIAFATGDMHNGPVQGRILLAESEGASLHPITENYDKYTIVHSPSISPDGSSIAYSTFRYVKGSPGYFGNDFERYFEIVTSSLDGAGKKRLTEGKGLDFSPVWSPNGDRIAFVRSYCLHPSSSSILGIFVMMPDGTKQKEIARFSSNRFFFEGETYAGGLRWAPDGQSLAYFVSERDRNEAGITLYTIRPDGSDKRNLHSEVLAPPFWRHLDWSPDGQQIAFLGSNEGRPKLYRVGRDGSNLHEVVELGIDDPWGRLPFGNVSWSPGGDEMLFSLGNAIYVVDSDGTNLRAIGAGQYGSWSPNGSRIAGVWPASSHVILLTMQPDGSNVRTLATRETDGSILPVLANPNDRPTESESDASPCSTGVAILDPEANLGLVRDCNALIRIRDRLTGGVHLNWSEGTPIVEWEGIILSASLDGVTGIYLPEYGLMGTIPVDFQQLSELRVLNLYGNKLTGPIPPEIGSLKNLQELSLLDNSLVGYIPPELGGLKNLQILRLSGRNLGGPIPPELGNLTGLQELQILSGSLRGQIPPELGALTNLQVLTLRGVLIGPIPLELGQLTQLRILDLSHNDASGPIGQFGPVGVDGPVGLSGSIPGELSNLSLLETLDLSFNELIGGIPPELSNLSALTTLNLSYNDLSGCLHSSLPDIWTYNSRLERCR